MIDVLLIDDHPVVLEGLARYLALEPSICVIARAATGRDALSAAEDRPPDVCLVDLRLPDLSYGALIAGLRARAPRARIVVLTSFIDLPLATGVLALGVDGYLLKQLHPEAIVSAIRRVHAGQPVFAPEIQSLQWRAEAIARDPDRLTDRELDVLQHLGRGLTNKEIAARLHVTEKTVKTHISHILAKLGARDRTGAVVLGLERGLIHLRDQP